jgi:hypothetical protein
MSRVSRIPPCTRPGDELPEQEPRAAYGYVALLPEGRFQACGTRALMQGLCAFFEQCGIRIEHEFHSPCG